MLSVRRMPLKSPLSLPPSEDALVAKRVIALPLPLFEEIRDLRDQLNGTDVVDDDPELVPNPDGTPHRMERYTKNRITLPTLVEMLLRFAQGVAVPPSQHPMGPLYRETLAHSGGFRWTNRPHGGRPGTRSSRNSKSKPTRGWPCVGCCRVNDIPRWNPWCPFHTAYVPSRKKGKYPNELLGLGTIQDARRWLIEHDDLSPETIQPPFVIPDLAFLQLEELQPVPESWLEYAKKRC